MNHLLYLWRRFWRKRLFSDKMMIENLRLQLMQDNQWLNSDPVARELTERYLAMLADDWEDNAVEPINQFRSRLNLEPYK